MKKEDYKKLYFYYKKESELNKMSLEKWKQLVKKNKDYSNKLENILEKYKNIEEERKLKKQAIKEFNEKSFISIPKNEPVIITRNSKNKIHRDLPRDSKGRFIKRS